MLGLKEKCSHHQSEELMNVFNAVLCGKLSLLVPVWVFLQRHRMQLSF